MTTGASLYRNIAKPIEFVLYIVWLHGWYNAFLAGIVLPLAPKLGFKIHVHNVSVVIYHYQAIHRSFANIFEVF